MSDSRATPPLARWLATTAMLSAALTACAPPPAPAREPWEAVIDVPPERKLCGWEERGVASMLAIGTHEPAAATPGDSVVLIAPTANANYGLVQAALRPAGESLVRVKLVFDGRWLLPTTYPQRSRQPPKPPKEHRAERIVGRRKITRDVRRPAERFASLRLHDDGTRMTLFVENDPQRGKALGAGELTSALMALEPRAEVFAITADESTPWPAVEKAIVALACYDRNPGDEPHEVVLD